MFLLAAVGSTVSGYEEGREKKREEREREKRWGDRLELLRHALAVRCSSHPKIGEERPTRAVTS